ncbi:unnamed protein product [Cladocopium goreaui]|uniref:Cyclin-dependent kinase 2 homolog n=1 Tax=Cladocopium goreaui TaxID=2562237 RepID=A0A9P1FU10_9DINO|nr:unnamed protein product [Cladocopium goreaui]
MTANVPVDLSELNDACESSVPRERDAIEIAMDSSDSSSLRHWDTTGQQEGSEASEAENEMIVTGTDETDLQIKAVMKHMAHSIARMEAFQQFGAALRPRQRGSFYHKSRESHKISTFWSHSWRGGHWRKLLTLVIFYNGTAAVSLGFLASLLVMLLFLFGLLPGLERPFGNLQVKWSCWSLCSGCIVTSLVTIFWRPQTEVFLDRICISQVGNLKGQAIFSLAGMLQKSDKLLILWDPTWTERLWCRFELAAFLQSKKATPCDRKILKECVKIWFGSEQAFEDTVRSEILEILNHDLNEKVFRPCDLAAGWSSYKRIGPVFLPNDASVVVVQRMHRAAAFLGCMLILSACDFLLAVGLKAFCVSSWMHLGGGLTQVPAAIGCRIDRNPMRHILGTPSAPPSRNAAAVDPERVLREHQRCSKVEAAVLDDLADCLPLGCNVAYASNPAEAQRSGREHWAWMVVVEEEDEEDEEEEEKEDEKREEKEEDEDEEDEEELRLLGNWELVLREGQVSATPAMDIDLLNPDAKEEKCKHKLKRMIQSPNSFFMDVKCPGCLQITTVFSHAQTVVLCGNCNVMLCQPTGGLARLTESFVMADLDLVDSRSSPSQRIVGSGDRPGFRPGRSPGDAKRVAVLIPGTQTPQDCVTDLKALPVKVLADGSDSDFMPSLIGWVHRGMMRQASAIIRLVGSALERFEKDGYEVLFIGHSLGAGVSAIAGAVARLGIEKVKLKKVRSFCYATPAIGNGSFGKYCEGHAITVINCEDIVPRLSLETARKLREELSTRREAVRLFVSEDIAALKDVNNITEKKTRSKSASLKAMEVKQGEEAAEELANLGIPAPLPGTSAKVAAEVRMFFANVHLVKDVMFFVDGNQNQVERSKPVRPDQSHWYRHGGRGLSRYFRSLRIYLAGLEVRRLAMTWRRGERLESNIGEGTYGKVHKAFHVRSGEIVAIKKAKETVADRDVGGIGFTALREVKVMQAIQHPNVMTCLDVFVEGQAVHLVMPYMDTDLKKIIEDTSIDLTEVHCKCLAQQVLQGLGASLGVDGVDVTPNNVLLSFRTGLAKLSDFGFTRSLSSKRPMTTMCTTLWYRAPELLFGAKFYGTAVDLWSDGPAWSCGCVISELVLRHPLFPGRREFDMLQKAPEPGEPGGARGVIECRGTPTEEVWKDVSSLPNFLDPGFFTHPFPHPAIPPLPATQTPWSDVSSAFRRVSDTYRQLLDALLALDPKQRPKAQEALRLEPLGALKHNFFTSKSDSCEAHQLPFVQGEKNRRDWEILWIQDHGPKWCRCSVVAKLLPTGVAFVLCSQVFAWGVQLGWVEAEDCGLETLSVSLRTLGGRLLKMQLESQHRTPLSPLFSQLKGVAARVAGYRAVKESHGLGCHGMSLKLEDLLEPDDTDPASIRLVPPGRLIHLARYSGARRAWWVQRSHPVLHRIQVHHGIGQDHSGDSYREGLQEALLAANGILPKPWAPVDQAATCSCCSTDFVWSTVLRSEPHRLAARCRCHSCGDVVCDGCSQRKLPLPHVGILREVRVCDRCFLKPKTVTR